VLVLRIWAVLVAVWADVVAGAGGWASGVSVGAGLPAMAVYRCTYPLFR
jgi:hypothetical protein